MAGASSMQEKRRRLLQQQSNEALGTMKDEAVAAGALPAHARNLRIAEIKMDLGM